MTPEELDRIEKIVEDAKVLSLFEHADDHFKFSDEIMLSMPKLIKAYREQKGKIDKQIVKIELLESLYNMEKENTKFQQTENERLSERIKLLEDALDKIAMLGSSEISYTKEFTEKVNMISRSALMKITE